MNVIELARESGMAVILDGRIGREEYQSVCGSLSALQRFADALRAATANEYFCPVSPHTGPCRFGSSRAGDRQGVSHSGR